MRHSLRKLLLCLAAVLSLPMCSEDHHDGPPIPTTHTLTILVSGNGTTDPAAGAHVHAAGQAVTVKAVPAAGAAFSGWSGAIASTDGSVTITMDADRTLTAAFTGPYGVAVNPIAGLSPDFIKGADVSMLAQLEAKGGKFLDEDGAEKDCLQILKEHGVNWVRLRLWNAPVLAHGFSPESGLEVVAGDAAAGINDLARDLALAQRARALGLKVLLDFHYSDWWADPAKQFKPQAWEELSLEELKVALHDFTEDAVTQLKAAGAGPDMVQLGNEVTNGMLWSNDAASGWVDNEDPSTFTNFAALLGEGAQAVREVDPAIPLMIHIDRGGNNALSRRFFGTLIELEVDFDVIGLSYYPAWHGTMAALRANLEDISQEFQLPVVVAETAYPWTTEDADDVGNGYSGVPALTAGPYLPTVQGQATFLRDLMAIVSGVPGGRGLGVFYWEPDWIVVEGAGWYTRGDGSHVGQSWDNQAMFDHEGRALASLNVFRAVSEDRPSVEATPVSVPAQGGISTKTGTVPVLPDANVVFSDDSVRALPVTWDAIDPAMWSTPGSYELEGTAQGTALRVTLPVTVSFLENAGFEDGFTGWTYGPASGTLSVPAENSHGGTHAFHWWNAGPVDIFVEQTVVLPAGKTYAFSAYAMGPVAHAPLYAYAQCGSAAELTATIALLGWGSANWVQGSIPGLSGTCTVGVRTTTTNDSNNNWGNLDDFALVEEL